MGKCMGLTLCFRCEPSPPALDVPDDGLAAFVNVDVLDRDLLLAFAAVAIEGFQQRRVCPRELIRLAQISRLPSNVCSPIMARR
jgi:hypothetical protein